MSREMEECFRLVDNLFIIRSSAFEVIRELKVEKVERLGGDLAEFIKALNRA